MEKNIKTNAIIGLAWTGGERIFSLGFQFIIGIIIARQLFPEDYGIMGMLSIFLAVSQTFLDSGFGSSLIQKKDRTSVDYSTVFWFNQLVAVIIYTLLFICSPIIASFYNMPILTDVARVVFLSIIINGLTIVQTAKLTIDLEFKLQAIATIVSVLISSAVGIVMAYNGFGVWALVFQTLSSATIRLAILWIYSNWMPRLEFSCTSFRKLFSFGSKILCSGLINTIYQNMYTLVIGKIFSPADVGYYNRGEQFAQIPVNTFTQVLVKVNYPILSELQDNNSQLVSAYKHLLRTPLFILYPLLFGLAAIAEPLISLLLGEKWLPCVPLLKVLLLGYMWSPLTHINLNLLYVKGRSDIVLKLELIKKPIAFILLIVCIPLGVLWMCVGRAIYFFIAFGINCFYTKKIMNYGMIQQLSELIPIIVNSSIMYIVIAFSIQLVDDDFTKLTLGIIVGSFSYLLYAKASNDNSLHEITSIINKRIKK